MRRALAALALLPALACSACVPQGLTFRVDHRVKITAPRNEAKLSLPFTLRWTVNNFDVVQPGSAVRNGAGYFGVFVDTTPMAPGKNLDDLRNEDASCDGDSDCTPESLLASRGIYTTTSTELVLKSLPPAKDKKSHRATVVLLDSRGTRIGESAWRVDFRVPDQEEQS